MATAYSPGEADGLIHSPKSLEILESLLAIGEARPTFDATLPPSILRSLREGLSPSLALIPEGESLHVSAHGIQQVLSCERRWTEETWQGWTVETARGTLAHRGIERLIFDQHRSGSLTPYAAVVGALQRMVEDDQPSGMAAFVGNLTDEEQHDLIREAVDAVTKYEADWPRLKPEWRPRVETRRVYSLFANDQRLVLHAKFDLALGRPRTNRACTLISDLKTGNRHDSHASQLRYYALVETLAASAPPFRVSAYYLDGGQYWTEDVDETTLELSVRRTTHAVRMMVELRYGDRVATETSSPLCRYCDLLEICQTGQRQLSTHQTRGSDS
jgi:hypothetical protein